MALITGKVSTRHGAGQPTTPVITVTPGPQSTCSLDVRLLSRWVRGTHTERSRDGWLPTNGSARAMARKFRASPTLTGGGGVERISACHGQRDSEPCQDWQYLGSCR